MHSYFILFHLESTKPPDICKRIVSPDSSLPLGSVRPSSVVASEMPWVSYWSPLGIWFLYMNEKEVMTRASMSGDYKENMSFMIGLWPRPSKPTSDLKGLPFLKQTDIRRWKAASGRFLAAQLLRSFLRMLEEVPGVVFLQRNSGLCVHDRGMSGAQCPEGYSWFIKTDEVSIAFPCFPRELVMKSR